ncbi:hypothetical protein EH999_22275, partial [Escherichia coli]
LMMSLWDALRMNMMISYQELVRTFPSILTTNPRPSIIRTAGTLSRKRYFPNAAGTGNIVHNNIIITHSAGIKNLSSRLNESVNRTFL